MDNVDIKSDTITIDAIMDTQIKDTIKNIADTTHVTMDATNSVVHTIECLFTTTTIDIVPVAATNSVVHTIGCLFTTTINTTNAFLYRAAMNDADGTHQDENDADRTHQEI